VFVTDLFRTSNADISSLKRSIRLKLAKAKYTAVMVFGATPHDGNSTQRPEVRQDPPPHLGREASPSTPRGWAPAWLPAPVVG
jgi:hypothetical protein